MDRDMAMALVEQLKAINKQLSKIVGKLDSSKSDKDNKEEESK